MPFLVETKISESAPTNHLKFPKYECHASLRKNGGVMAFVRSNLSCSRVPALESGRKDILWLKLNLKPFPKFICCLYRSPSDNNWAGLLDYLSEKIDFLNSHFPSSEVALLGDFNVHNESWLGSNKTDAAGRAVEAFAISQGLTQLVKEPTFFPLVASHSTSLLDLFLTTHPVSYTIDVQSPLGNSDHGLVEVKFPSATDVSAEIRPSRKIWHYGDADWNGLRDFFSSFPWNDVCFAKHDVSTVCSEITEVILVGMEAYIPHTTKTFKPGSNGWFNKSCDTARRQKVLAHRTYLQDPTVENRQADIEARNRYNGTVRQAKSQHDAKIKQKVMSRPNGSRSFWTLAKQIEGNSSRSSFPPITCADGTVATAFKDKAEVYAKTFAANSTLNVPSSVQVPSIPKVPHAMSEITFRTKAVRKVLQSLDINKATGPDMIPAVVAKKCAPELAPILTRLFRMSYSSGVFPKDWKSACIQPVPKKGSKADPSNYRPIALLSVISKVMEKCVNQELMKYLELHQLINDRQYGFRHQRSTGDLLAYVTHVWNKLIHSFGEAHVVALDISKAFDQLWHASLLNKLPSYGLPVKLCDWLADFFSGRKITVVVDGFSSSFHNINAGVPQGSVFAPTLFLLHINDLLSSTTNPIHSFADDSTLHAGIMSNRPISVAELERRRLATAASLSKDLEAITALGLRNMVEFNASKTQYCTLSNKRCPSEHSVLMNNQALPRSHSFKLIGVSITENMIWHEHVSSIATAAGKKFGYLFRARKYFSPSNLLTLYKAQIRPSL
nr:unnamed protein product [Callosobruchus chinensis]